MAFNIFKTIKNVVSNPSLAISNALNRYNNAYNASLNPFISAGAAFYPNSSTTGDVYYNSPPQPASGMDTTQMRKVAGPIDTRVQSQQLTAPDNSLGSGGSTYTPPSSLGVFNGKEYFNPLELARDQLGYLDTQYGQQLRQGQDQYGTNKNNLLTSLTDLMNQYDTQQNQGLQNIGAYYSNLGEGYQSSQGVRENQLRNDTSTARNKTQTQYNTNLSALDKSLQDFTSGLASQYQQARDTAANNLLSDTTLSTLKANKPQFSALGMDANNVNTNQNLITNLMALRPNGSLRPDFRNGNGVDTDTILKYLAGLA